MTMTMTKEMLPNKTDSTHRPLVHHKTLVTGRVIGMDNPRQHCMRCGSAGPFRSPLALKCIECDKATEEERREYHRTYHQARGAAIKTLIETHADEFNNLMIEERERLAQAAMAEAMKKATSAKSKTSAKAASAKSSTSRAKVS